MSKNLAICYNNIACIHTKQKNYQKQYLYFMRSIQIAEENIKLMTENKIDSASAPVETRFKLACRLYNQGYALYLQYLYLIKRNNIDDLLVDVDIERINQEAIKHLDMSLDYLRNLELVEMVNNNNRFQSTRSFMDMQIFMRLLKVELKIYS